MKKRCILMALILCCLFSTGFYLENSYADGGGIIGEGGISGGSGGGSSGGGGDCSDPDARMWLLECTGYSWIYYKSTGKKVDSVDFTPSSGNLTNIPKECSAHTDQGGGFWHLGRNAQGKSYGGFTDYPPETSSTYYVRPGTWGHMDTYNYDFINSYTSWKPKYKIKGDLSGSLEIGDLGHTLYKNGTEIYKASKWGKKDLSNVMEDYEKACLYSNAYSGTSYNCSEMGGRLKYFCYWDDMDGESFQGKVSVSGSASGNNPNSGYTQATLNIKNVEAKCSPDGCKVTFNHEISKKSGESNNKTSYTITRGSAIISSGNTSKIPFKFSDTQTMLPGQTVCETLSFKPFTNKNDIIKIPICVKATGNAQPSGDGSLLKMEVRNKDVAKYNSFQVSNIHAKPGDNLEFRATYNPTLQYTYSLRPQSIKIDGGVTYQNDNNKTLGNLFNEKKGSLGNWNNAFSIVGLNFNLDELNHTYTYELGKREKQQPNSNTHTVRSEEVGKELGEKALTNNYDRTKTTPSQVKFSMNGLAEVTTKSVESTANALVPFNFINTTEISDTEDTVVYAGESKSIGVNITVNPKKNSLTTDGSEEQKYATSVEDAKYGIRLCTMEGENENCYDMEVKTENIDVSVEDSAKGVTVEKKVGVNIPDVVAGSQVCLYSTIYPGSSGGDGNLEKDGDKVTKVSERKCFTVAKRPSLQAWGGNIYTRGNIRLTESNKHHLVGYNDYNINPGSGTTYTFGSWGELGIIATGVIEGLSSGAGAGYQINDNGSLFPEYDFGSGDNGAGNNANINGRGPGGSTGTFCTRSPLSFANSMCNQGWVGSIGLSTAVNNADSDKSSILNKFNYKKEDNIGGGSIEINDDNNSKRVIKVDGEENSNVYYYYRDNSFTITSGEVSRGITIASSEEDITISGDLVYSGTFNSLNELPKLVIYANNVNINCNVERIDALIIANDKVRTCSDSSNINNIENSTQLKVNGAIISNNLEANRTYGASTGANSIIPAEIINFDPTLYKFGDIKKVNEETGETDEVEANLEMVFLREQAPRL